MALIRHRETARVILKSSSGRFLLMYTAWDPESGLEPRWVCPGGGVEPSEQLPLAAARELLEETGLRLDSSLFGPKIAEIAFEQTWISGDHETGIAHFFRFQIADEFEVNRSMWTPEEHRDILDVRWWHPSELKESGEPVGPPGLIDLLVELG